MDSERSGGARGQRSVAGAMAPWRMRAAAAAEQVSGSAPGSDRVGTQTGKERRADEAQAGAGSGMVKKQTDLNPGEPHTERPTEAEPTPAIRGGCSEDAEGVWRHPEQPEQASWTEMTTDDVIRSSPSKPVGPR